jgi:hypothetical protein
MASLLTHRRHSGGILAVLDDRGAFDPSLLDVAKTEIRHLPRLELHLASRRRSVVVRTTTECARAVADIRQSAADDLAEQRWALGVAAVGFDTETKPKFTKGGSAHKVALVQIATHHCAWLIRTSIIGVPPCLVMLLEDPSILKCGIGVRSDVSAVRTRVPSFDDHGSFCDLSDGFKKAFPLLRRLGLRNLSASVLGRNMSKGQQMSNWENNRLNPAQQVYAANDAFVGLELLGILTGVRHAAPHDNGNSNGKYGAGGGRSGQNGGGSASQRVRRVNLSVEIICSQVSLTAKFGADHGWTPCGCRVNSMPNLISHFMSKNFASRHRTTRKTGRVAKAPALAEGATSISLSAPASASSSHGGPNKRPRVSQQRNPVTTLDQRFPAPNNGRRPRPVYTFRFEGSVCVCDLKVVRQGQVQLVSGSGAALQGTGRGPTKKIAKRKAAEVVLARAQEEKE